jgi:hypothetical protein
VDASGGSDLVSSFAFFVEIAAVDVVHYGDGKVLDFQAAERFSTKLFVSYLLCPADALLLQQTNRELS